MFTHPDVDERLLGDPGVSPGWDGPLRWTIDDDGTIFGTPLWDVTDDEVGVVEDASAEESREAWASAAMWSQDRLDAFESDLRARHVAQSDALLLAHRTSLRDAAVRFGAAQGHRGSQAERLFFRKTALAMGTRPGRVSRRVDSLLRLRDSLPETHRAYRDLSASWEAVDLAVSIAEGLTAEQCAEFDGPAAAAAVSTPFASLKKRLRKIRADVRKGDAAETAKNVYERRSMAVEHGLDGEGSIILTGPILNTVAAESAIRLGAIAAHGVEGETRTLGQLQYDIAMDLILEGAKTAADPTSTTAAVPGRKGVVPRVVVTVPVLSLLKRTEEPARLEGYGPIDAETARTLAAGATSFHRLLTHPVTGVRLDLDRTTYKPPADLRLWVQLRDDVCRFPGCNRPASECDTDHATEWQDRGVTNAMNLMSLCRGDHNGKSAGLVTESIRSDDTVDWDTLWGRIASDPPPDPFDPVPSEIVAELGLAAGPEAADEPDDCPFVEGPDPLAEKDTEPDAA